MKPITRALMLSGLAAAALAVGVAAWIGQRQSLWIFTDGADLRAPRDSVQARQILWQSPTLLAESINTTVEEYEPRLSADGQMLMFVRGKPGENADIFVCAQALNGWIEPQPWTDINTDADELGPGLSPDASVLYFCSNRAGGQGGYDLWRSVRTDKGWGTPENLGPGINTSWNEHNPSLAPDGLTLYFASNRPRNEEITSADDPAKRWSATVRDNSPSHDFDLYSAQIAGTDIGEPRPLVALNTNANEGTPSMSPAGDFLYFSSDRAEGTGGFDLYRSRLLRCEWLAPESLGAQVNTSVNELDPALSMGGFVLHFSSDRGAAATEDPQRRQYDLFASVSREVFEERETVGDGINWASLLATVLPNLLWLLLGLLLVLLFLRFVRSGKMSALTLLTRCILLSLLAHVLLMMLFMIWGVTVGLADAIKRGGSMQVGLVSSTVGQGQGQGLVSQIRGDMTEAMMTPVGPTSEKQSLTSTPEDVTMSGVQLPDQHRPVRVSDRIAVQSNSSVDAPAPVQRLTMPATVDVPVDQQRSMQARIPDVAASSATNEASSPTLAAVNPTAKRSPTRVAMEAPYAATVQSSAAPLSPSTLSDSGTHGSLAGSLDARDSAPAGDVAPIPHASVAVTTPVPMTDVSLPRVERSGGGTATEAQATIAGVTPSTDRAAGSSAINPPDFSNGERGGAIVHVETASPVMIDGGGESLVAGANKKTTDATPSFAASNDEQGSAIGVPSLAAPDALPGLRTPAETSGPSSRIAASETQPGFNLAGGAASEHSGKIESLPALDGVSTSGGPINAGTTVAGSAIGDDKQSLVSTNLVGGLSDAIEPSSLGFSGSDSSASLIPALPGDTGEIRLPTETAPPVEVYRERAPENRLELVKERGGSEATERSVELALKWLAAHQSADGRWDADHFDDDCGRCGNPARFDADVATTGLALLCFMGANHTHTQDGPYRSQVQRGVDWLVSQQKDTGDLRGNETMYSHGIGSIALSEAYGMTRDQAILPHVRRAIEYIVRARDTSGRDGSPSGGGWRYEPGQAGDTSVLGWQVMALVSAKRAGIDVPADTMQAARNWLDRVSTTNNPGLYSYQPGERFTEAMTAEGMFSQQLLGRGRDEHRMRNSAEFITRLPPNWRNEPNTYYWYYATLALFQHQGEEWETWNSALTKQLLDNQNTSGAKAGSWDPLDRWSKIGGRIYQTALCTLCLEVYYRYLPLYGSHEAVQEVR